MYSPDPAQLERGSRRRLPELNINTASSSAREARDHRELLPQTPPSRKPPSSLSRAEGKSHTGTAPHRALRMPTHPPRDARELETFFDSLTPIDHVDNSNKENDRPPEPLRPNHRDSHDLSLSPRQVTRDSLVTNMLLSLDQFSMGQLHGGFGGSRAAGAPFDDPTAFSSFGAEDPSRSMTFNSRSGRNNSHGYSYSSDFEGGDDASRVSSQPSRGRRSNSSSGFQSSLGRINSMREATHQRNSPGTQRPLHSRGGKGSKSSSTNSIDPGYAQVLSSQRWAQGFGARSSSFDYGHGRTSTAAGTQQPPWHIEFSNSFFNDELDAAPTPTVPAGPRRLATVPSLPVLPVSEPPKSPNKGSGLERKRSTRSSKSATVGRKSGAKFDSVRNAPPVPVLDLESAPAPLVGYEKSKEVAPGLSTTVSAPAKEKQGFFRRMFGSSKNSLISTPESSSSPYISSTSVDTAGTRSQQGHSNSMKSQSTPPSRESHHSPTHVLQKKTSSFFRRRKQSVTDAEPPPLPVPAVVIPTVKLPPVEVMPEPVSAKPEPSPITSLRRAMDPFFHSNPATPDTATPDGFPSPLDEQLHPLPSPKEETREKDHGRSTRGFSPEYEPSPKALIRTVDADSGDDRTPLPRRMDTPSRQPPEPPSMARSGSFFNDNSDDESSPRRRPTRTPQAESAERDVRGKNQMVERQSSKASLRTVEGSRKPRDVSKLRSGALLSPSHSHDEGRREGSIALPIEGIPDERGPVSPTDTVHQSAISLPSVKVDSTEPSPKLKTSKSIDEPDFVVGDPTEDDVQKAQQIYDGNEEFIQRERAAAWMGEEGPVRQRTLRAYMALYDFKDRSVVASLRQVCNRLIFKGETQQVDRILVAFATRWCDCNPNHGFKAIGKHKYVTIVAKVFC